MIWIYIATIVSILYLLFAYIYLKTRAKGNKKMQHISFLIKNGSRTFLKTENKILLIAVLILGIIIAFFNLKLAIFFVIGSALSSLCGLMGMTVATSTNVKVSASNSLERGMRIAFFAGLFVSIFTMIAGLICIYALYTLMPEVNLLYGFAFGASLVALFLRVGGGIYTKSADVAADLAGKVEKSLPEDDERNPAVIADLVGDNVGDVAGMSADLFESYVESIIAAMVIALAFSQDVLVPLKVVSLGVIASVCSVIVIRGKNVYRALLSTIIISSLILALASYIFINEYFIHILIGLITGIIIGTTSYYYTSSDRSPTIKVSEASKSGAALVVLRGLSNGMLSTLIPVVAIAIAMIVSFNYGGILGISIAAVGMLSILGVTLASTIYGSISDNAAGIAEMSKLKSNREITETLDAAGNTTAAIGKGFAIGSAALTTLALLASFMIIAKITTIDIFKVENLAVLFIGTAIPFLFSPIVINCVSSTAGKIVDEIRLQFKDKKIMSGKKTPNYDKVISIAISSSIKGMLLPSIISVVVTVIIGLVFGVESLASFIVGVTSSALLMGLFMANAGASFDNAKKYIEAGHFGGKGSDNHKASVIGDTVGDPLKDSSGPALNILLKLVAVTALLLALIL